MLFPAKSFAFIIPKDLPTIEALIALHKAVKKDEDQALQRVATSFGEQSLITKGAVRFNDVRTTLNTRLDNAHSYLVLAGAISSTANSLYRLVREYKDFTESTFKYVKDKPFVAWYYTDGQPSPYQGRESTATSSMRPCRFGHQPDEGRAWTRN